MLEDQNVVSAIIALISAILGWVGGRHARKD